MKTCIFHGRGSEHATEQEGLITISITEPCAAEIQTAIFFSVKLSVINVETDRQEQCPLYFHLEFIKYSPDICWRLAEHKLQQVSIPKNKYLQRKQRATLFSSQQVFKKQKNNF
jgi:hypothetical protein